MYRAGGLKRYVAQHHHDMILAVGMFFLGSTASIACESRRCEVAGGSGFTEENDRDSTKQNGKIQKWATETDVSDVVRDSLIPGGRCAGINLGQSGKPGLDHQALSAKGVIVGDLIEQGRARTDHGHIAVEHVE